MNSSAMFEYEVYRTITGTHVNLGCDSSFGRIDQVEMVTKGITKGYPFEKMISSLFFNFRQFHRLGLVWLVFERLKSRIRNRLDPNLKIFLSLFSSRIERF